MSLQTSSKHAWDQDLGSLGGQSGIATVISPYSQHASANSSLARTSGVTPVVEYTPPVLSIDPSERAYYYQDRILPMRENEQVAIVRPIEESQVNMADVMTDQAAGGTGGGETYIAPSRKMGNRRQHKRTKESYGPGIPGLVDSHYPISSEAFSFSESPSTFVIVMILIVIAVFTLGAAYFVFMRTGGSGSGSGSGMSQPIIRGATIF
jgi:hypothetical protein